MVKRMALTGLLAAIAVTASWAEPMRPVLTKEGNLPAAKQLELTLSQNYTEIRDEQEFFDPNDRDQWTTTLQARYGLSKELSLKAEVPFVSVQPNMGDDEAGIGDVSAGLELMAFKDIFGYPYFMPYTEVSFATGDEDKGLGEGETVVTFGAVVGTTVYDVLHYALDARYDVYEQKENVASVGGSLIWDVSKKLSFLAEGLFTEKRSDESTNSKKVLGGFTYKAAPGWMLGFYGGKDIDGPQDVIAEAKAVYSF